MNNNKENRFFDSNLFVIIIIITLGLLVYLPFIFKFGFYADDWQILTDSIANTSQVQLFSIDRPFLGYSFTILKSLLGVTPIYWHMAILAFRIICSILIFILVKKIFTVDKRIASIVAIIFFFFPGFLRQPSSVCYITHTIAFTCAILSIYLSLLSIDNKKTAIKIFLIFLSIVLELVYLLYIEYFIGLEIFRIIAIYLYLKKNRTDAKIKIKEFLLILLPYLVVAGIFLVWRFFIFRGERSAIDQSAIFSEYLTNPRTAIVTFGKDFYTSVLNLLFMSWVVPLYSFIQAGSTREVIISGVLSVFCCSVFLAYFILSAKHPTQSKKRILNGQGVRLIIVGVIYIFITFLPIIFARRNYVFEGYWDRYSIPPFLGVAFIVGGIIDLLKDHKKLSYAITAVTIFLAILTQVQNGYYYANAWKIQKNFWQQIVWRIPQMDVGTTFIPVLPLGAQVSDEIEAFTVLNTIYYPNQNLKLKGQILNDISAVWILKGAETDREIRGFDYAVDYSSIVLAVMPTTESCVHIIDPQQLYFAKNDFALVRVVSDRASIEHIQVTASEKELPQFIFGSELPHDWCYYYQKANLARQSENWEEIIALEKESSQLGLEPHDFSEWLPFLEAYAHLKMGDDYTRVIFKILVDENTRFYLCYDLSRSPYYDSSEINHEIVNDICNIEHELNIP